jgi:hypothetical protein
MFSDPALTKSKSHCEEGVLCPTKQSMLSQEIASPGNKRRVRNDVSKMFDCQAFLLKLCVLRGFIYLEVVIVYIKLE